MLHPAVPLCVTWATGLPFSQPGSKQDLGWCLLPWQVCSWAQALDTFLSLPTRATSLSKLRMSLQAGWRAEGRPFYFRMEHIIGCNLVGGQWNGVHGGTFTEPAFRAAPTPQENLAELGIQSGRLQSLFCSVAHTSSKRDHTFHL